MAKVYPFFLAGEWQQSEEWLEVRSPHTGEVVGTTSIPTSEQLERAVRGAVAAFETTRRLSSEERAGILTRIRDGVAARKEDFVRIIVQEAGGRA